MKNLGTAPTVATDLASKGYVDALLAMRHEAAISAGPSTLTASTFYTLDMTPASSDNTVLALPTSPPDGTVVGIARRDTGSTNSYIGWINIGGTDRFPWGFSYGGVRNLGTVAFVYYGGCWYPIGFGQSGYVAYGGWEEPNPGVLADSVMARDDFGRSQVAEPAVAADIATKNYVDGKSAPAADPLIVATCFR